MGRPSFILFLWIIVVAIISGPVGCGTVQTMPSLERYGTPKIYSGVRLDFHTIVGNESHLKRLKVKPPAYPLLDLPFSLILDTIILPVTFPLATYEVLFGL
jgi:uncharacterized protein YceK